MYIINGEDKKYTYRPLHRAESRVLSTGVVTSTRVTHATPASTYAHVANRDWECDGSITAEDMEKCPELKDIARQLIEDEPGFSLNVRT